MLALPGIAEEALRYRGLGWSIIALSPRSKKPICNWRRFCTNRPRTREVQRWFAHAGRNVGVICGPVSGDLCVRDFDIEEAYFDWAADHPDLADRLPTSRTGKGFHVFLRIDQGDSTLPPNGVQKMPDGELRVQKCYVTLPPSVHQNGRRYEWLREPHHGIPLICSVADAGLIPPPSKTGFGGARAPVLTPCHYKPLQSHELGAPARLFDAAGRLSGEAFDELLGWTLPTGPRMREACLWRLVRFLKTLPETRSLRVDDLEPVVRYWWQMALPKIQTKEWFETWAAFARAWERAIVPMTETGGQMTAILDKARRAGCPAELRDRFGSDVCGLVAAICRELAAEADGGQFFLCRDALSRLCGISQGQASACLKALIASRVIRRVKEAERGRAAEYIYLRPV